MRGKQYVDVINLDEPEPFDHSRQISARNRLSRSCAGKALRR